MGDVIDSSGWLGDRGLCPGWQTPSLLDPRNPSIAFIQPPEPPFIPPPAASDPSSQSCFLLAMCWESKGSHLSLVRMGPRHLSPSIALADRDGLGHPRPCNFQGGPRPTKGLLSVTNNRGGSRRSEQVKSATLGRKL